MADMSYTAKVHMQMYDKHSLVTNILVYANSFNHAQTLVVDACKSLGSQYTNVMGLYKTTGETIL